MAFSSLILGYGGGGGYSSGEGEGYDYSGGSSKGSKGGSKSGSKGASYDYDGYDYGTLVVVLIESFVLLFWTRTSD